MSASVLVLYDAKGLSIESMALALADGVESSGAATPRLLTIDKASRDDLLSADGIALGSPNWSGITGSFKQWLDDQGGSLGGTRLGRASGGRLHHRHRPSFRPRNHPASAGPLDAPPAECLWLGLLGLSGCAPLVPTYGATAAGGANEDDLAQAKALGVRLAGYATLLRVS